MSDQGDAIIAGIDTLEIARIKGGLWKMTLDIVLSQTGQRGVDWHPETIFAQIEDAVKQAQNTKGKDFTMIEGHIQDAVAEYRAEARAMLKS